LKILHLVRYGVHEFYPTVVAWRGPSHGVGDFCHLAVFSNNRGHSRFGQPDVTESDSADAKLLINATRRGAAFGG
jgi:hypothetical protein